MRLRIRESDLPSQCIRLISGAGASITLKLRNVEGREFVQLEDLANIADKRLSLRCLIPLPGWRTQRDGSVYGDPDLREGIMDQVLRSVSLFESAGWTTRLIADIPLVSSLVIDQSAVVYYEYLNNEPGPFISGDARDISHYQEQFEQLWSNSYAPKECETLYRDTQGLGVPAESVRVATVSNDMWSQIIRDLSQSPRLMYQIDPRKFEELIAELLKREGLDVKLTPSTRDGGRDLMAFHDTPVGKLLYLVECKRYSAGRPVGVTVVRQLFGVVSQVRATAGLIVTTSRFTKDALCFARTLEHQMGLRGYEDVRSWLQSHKK